MSSRRQRSIPLGGRYRQVSLYIMSVAWVASWNPFYPVALKGAVRHGTFKFIDFKKNWYIKVPVVLCSLMLWSKSCLCHVIRKFAFLCEEIISHEQQCAQMCRGGACKPGLQEIAISNASLYPPMCLKCRVSAQWFNTAMLPSVKRWGIISAMDLFILLWIQS